MLRLLPRPNDVLAGSLRRIEREGGGRREERGTATNAERTPRDGIGEEYSIVRASLELMTAPAVTDCAVAARSTPAPDSAEIDAAKSLDDGEGVRETRRARPVGIAGDDARTGARCPSFAVPSLGVIEVEDMIARTWMLRSLMLSGVSALAACSSPAQPTGTSSQASVGMSSLGSMSPSWAQSKSFAGRVSGATPVSLQVHLAMHDEADAKALLARISDPDDSVYGQYLSDAEFAVGYGPTAADVAAVRAHLEANGLKVTFAAGEQRLPRRRRNGVERRSSFRHAPRQLRGRRRAASRADGPGGPPHRGSLARAHGPRPPPPRRSCTRTSSAPTRATARRPRRASCSEWYGQDLATSAPPYGDYPYPLAYTPCGYHPAQLRQAYGIESLVRGGNDGTGQKIAIVDAFTPPTLVEDAQTYFANNDSDYPLATSQVTLLQGPGTLGTIDKGWYGESSLDVEAVHAMAPGADIVYMGAVSANDADLIAAVNTIVTGHLASLISNSYDGLELQTNDFTAWESMAIQAGLKGIGLYFASGDNGDESTSNSGAATVDFPASLTEVTAVGGTSLALGADGQTLFQVGWETGASNLQAPDAGVDDGGDAGQVYVPGPPGAYRYGAGGGVSVVYLQPTWQKGIVPASLSTFLNAVDRTVPDVAMDADPNTGYIIGMTSPRSKTYSESAIGGTSLATPLFTATMALAQQYAGKTFGQANAALYKASKKSAFTDVAPGEPRGGLLRHPRDHVRLPRRRQHQLHRRRLRHGDRARRPERHELHEGAQVAPSLHHRP